MLLFADYSKSITVVAYKLSNYITAEINSMYESEIITTYRSVNEGLWNIRASTVDGEASASRADDSLVVQAAAAVVLDDVASEAGYGSRGVH